MPEKKMNWGTLILGVVIGAVVVGIVWMAQKPAETQGQNFNQPAAIQNLLEAFDSCTLDHQKGGQLAATCNEQAVCDQLLIYLAARPGGFDCNVGPIGQ